MSAPLLYDDDEVTQQQYELHSMAPQPHSSQQHRSSQSLSLASQSAAGGPAPLSMLRVFLSLCLTMTGILFFAVAIASRQLYHSQVDDNSDNYADLGAFQMSAHVVAKGLELSVSSVIDHDCYAQFSVLGVDLPKKQILEKCGAWNGARGVMVTAGILGFFGLISQITSARLIKSSFLIRRLGIIFPLLASLFGIIAMSIYVNEKSHDAGIKSDAKSTTTFGLAFWLLLGQTLLFGLSAVAFGMPNRSIIVQQRRGNQLSNASAYDQA